MQQPGAAAMARYTILDVLTPISVVAVIVVNLFTQDAIDVAKISDRYFTALTPAGYASFIWFVIWGVQLLAMVWLLYRPDDSENTKHKRHLSQEIGPWWISGGLLEISWLFLYGTATKRTFAAAALSLIYSSFAFVLALFAVEPPNTAKVFTRDGTGLVAAGSALNAAWLSVTASANILTFQLLPTEQVELAAVLLGCVAGIGMFISLRTCSIAYPLALVWALVGVVMVDTRATSVRVFAGLGAGLNAGTAVVNTAARLLASVQYSKPVSSEKDEGDADSDETAGDEQV